MSPSRPNLIVLGGPNGAGKSTAAPSLLRDELAVDEFVNADEIERDLGNPGLEAREFAAGRIMLKRIAAHACRGIDFAFESTLASRTLAMFLRDAGARGYRIHLVFLWLDETDLAVARVSERVKAGGHNVPEATIRRRYHRGIENFFRTYKPLADHWRFYDNSGMSAPRLIARGTKGAEDEVIDGTTWRRARSSA